MSLWVYRGGLWSGRFGQIANGLAIITFLQTSHINGALLLLILVVVEIRRLGDSANFRWGHIMTTGDGAILVSTSLFKVCHVRVVGVECPRQPHCECMSFTAFCHLDFWHAHAPAWHKFPQ